jgi:hypothetical protein
MKLLQQFLNGFNFINMKPEKNIAKAEGNEKAHVTVLAETGKQYAIYLFGGTVKSINLEVPVGNYRAEWVNTLTGKIEKDAEVNNATPPVKLEVPTYQQDIALRLLKR